VLAVLVKPDDLPLVIDAERRGVNSPGNVDVSVVAVAVKETVVCAVTVLVRSDDLPLVVDA
jgi:hypothetical protein